jgi:hypothetical protein
MNSRTGGSPTYITAHRPTIELPQRPQAMATQDGMTLPELTGQISRGEPMAFKTTTDSQAAQRHRGIHQRSNRFGKGIGTTGSGMHLHRIRIQLTHEGRQHMAPLAMVVSPDQSMRASRQTAATAVTTGRIDP